jgi:hypothetical protein
VRETKSLEVFDDEYKSRGGQGKTRQGKERKKDKKRESSRVIAPLQLPW